MFEVMEMLLNKTLRFDPRTPGFLKKLSGKIIQVEIMNVNLRFDLIFTPDLLQISHPHKMGEPNVTLRGNLADFIYILFEKDLSLRLKENINIEGEIETLQLFQAFFLNLEIDWEEILSHFTNDVIAHQATTIIQTIKNNGRDLLEQFTKSTALYVTEEAKILPTHYEVQDWMHAVDTLQNDVARTEARLSILEAQIKHPRDNKV